MFCHAKLKLLKLTPLHIGALHKAGHISADNVGSFHKVKWSRASRTDKGVHSLGTVIALRMNVEDSMLHQDTEGSEIANGINKHLPPNARVLSVQKVGASPAE